MDPGWDHTENEDKLLLYHTSRMAQDMSSNVDSVVYGTEVSSMSSGGCSNNKLITNYEIISLNIEYTNYLSEVVINNVNKCNIKYYIDENILFDLYLYNLFYNFIKYKYPHYYSIVSKIISNIKSSLSCYINILSFILCHLNNVVSYIHIISTIFHCVHSEIREVAKCLRCYVNSVKSAFKCYITKLILDVECIIEIGKNGEYLQNLQVSIQTCTDEFEKSICTEIKRLFSICFYPALLFSIRDNLNKVIKLMTSNNNELSKVKASISIHNIENLMTYINLNCEMMDIIKSEISSLILYVHQYGYYFHCICCYISCLKSAFCESVEKLKTSVDIKIKECFCNLRCNLTKLEINVTCEIPDFSKVTTQINSLISILECHESDFHIYDCEIEQYLSSINCDYGSLKVYSDCIQDQILRNGYINKVLFKCSLQSLSTHLIKINTANNNRLIKDIGVPETNNLLINLMSRTVIDESIFVISRLYMYYKTKDLIDETLQILDRCICVKIYNRDWRDKIETFDKPLPNVNTRYYSPTIISLMMTHILNDGNYMCLCLVVRYILLSDLYALLRYNEHLYMDLLSCMSRSYKKYSYSMTHNFNVLKLIMLIITAMDKIIKWMNNIYIGEKIHCYCYDINNSYYSYLISIILYVSSLIENIWSMDNLSMVSAIGCVSSLLSEYQSIHVYTNYYSHSRYKILRNIVSGLLNGKLIESTASYSGMGIGVRVDNNKWSVTSNITTETTSTESQDRSKKTKLVISTIKRGSAGVLNHSTKSCFIALKTMILSSDFSKDKFTLLYGKYSRMLFYTKSCNLITEGRMRTMKNIGMEISKDYLDKLCKKECDRTCCKIGDGVCKICPIAKIKISCLCISLKRIKLALGNVSGDVLLNYLIESVDRSRDFITNLCVGFGEVYTIMLKNPLINNDHVLRSYGNIGVTNVETRNWGYDTKYEHDVTTDKGFSNQYPYVTNSDRTGNKKFKINDIKLNIP